MESNLLLLEEDDSGNDELLKLYHDNADFLRSVFFENVPLARQEKLAYLLYDLRDSSFEWKVYLEALGVNRLTISKIDYRSNHGKDPSPPFLLAFQGPLLSTISFGEFLGFFISEEKWFILRHLKDFIKDLIRRKDDFTNQTPTTPSAPPSEDITSNGTDLPPLIRIFDENTSREVIGSGFGSSSSRKENQIITDCLQKSMISRNNVQNKKLFTEPPEIEKPKVDHALNMQLISIFILHAMPDKRIAKRLSSYFKMENFKVVTLANVCSLLNVNHTKILKTMFEKIDFIVPIVSEEFLQKIEWNGPNEYDDIESAAIRFMYDLILNEYSCRGCHNFRVRAVRVPDGRSLFNIDPILSWSFQLWDESEKLVQNLRKGKHYLYNCVS